MRRLGGGLHLFLAEDTTKDKNIRVTMMRSIIREIASRDDIKVFGSDLETLREKKSEHA